MAKTDTTLTSLERDAIFLEHFKRKAMTFDAATGRIFFKNGKEPGCRQPRSWNIMFFVNKHNFAITRGRAIWLLVNGLLTEEGMVVHESTDQLDDSIGNLKFVPKTEYLRMQGKKAQAALMAKGKLTVKMTMEQVNDARRIFARKAAGEKMTITYQSLADSYGVSKQSLLYAVQGRTWQNATEPPVGKIDQRLHVKTRKERAPVIPGKSEVAKRVLKRMEEKQAIVVIPVPVPEPVKPKPILVKEILPKIPTKTRWEVFQENHPSAVRLVSMLLRNNPSITIDGMIKFLSGRKVLGGLVKNDVRYIMTQVS